MEIKQQIKVNPHNITNIVDYAVICIRFVTKNHNQILEML